MVEESKIDEHEKIERITESRKNLERAVAAIPEINKKHDKILEELCEGPDCVKNRLSTLEKKMAESSTETDQEGVICAKCGSNIKPLSSYCSNCGHPIYTWEDSETGQSKKDWKPYFMRPGVELYVVPKEETE